MAVYEYFRPRGILVSRRLVLYGTVLLHKDKKVCDLVQKVYEGQVCIV